jgi:hypothetical protein
MLPYLLQIIIDCCLEKPVKLNIVVVKPLVRNRCGFKCY